ncbi:DUF3177 family protein [Altericista sp. CCNU0014]|uniref:DUF3177 family protein n=1 Tax=Altericista sp. CCNU0014 TaxID=3082949 RepID=UPI00384AF29D
MSVDLLRSIVWTDYRLAVLFGVLCPLGLMAWAIYKKAKPITHLLVIYWRVASLLAISVYLAIGQSPLSFIAGFAALLLIPVSLWLWVDLNEEIEDRRGLLKLMFNAWRWAMTLYCAIAAVLQVPYLQCAGSKAASSAPQCQVWLEPALLFKSMFHAGTRAEKLGFLAIMALVFYGLYLGYFLIFKLTKQGRSATGF